MKRIMGSIVLSCSVLVFLVSSPGAQTLKVGMTSKTLFYLPLFVAQKKGFYSGENLRVEQSTYLGLDIESMKKIDNAQ